MIDTASETWGDLLEFLRDEANVAQDIVNSPNTPDNLTNFNRGILALASRIIELPHRNTATIEGRKA